MSASSLSDGYPAGQVAVTHTVLTSRQGQSLEVLIVVSSFSMTSVILLLMVLAMYAIRASYYRTGDVVFRSHVAAYFISLLFTDLFQAIGSIMNARWIQNMAVDTGAFCIVQGVIKQAADVGTALWVLIIAVHTFSVLFLNVNVHRSVMYIVLFGGWCFIGIVVGIGPSLLATKDKGPFFSISGYWCWISESYKIEEIVLDYMLMFASAFFSFSMYMLVFLRLRGNIVLSPGKRIGFRKVCRETAWASAQGHEASDSQRQMTSITKHMLLYPIAYTVLIVPIAAVRFSGWMGHEVPFGAVIFSDSVFLLSGLVNATLFVTTGRILSYAKIRALFGDFESDSMVGASAEKCWNVETAMPRTSVNSNFMASRSACDIEKDLPPVPDHNIYTRGSQCEVVFFSLTPTRSCQ